MSRKLRVCAALAGVAAAAACTDSPLAPSRADAPESAMIGLGYGSGHLPAAAVRVDGGRGRDSARTMVISGGLGYGSGH